MKFCSVVPEICRGQVHALRKERIRIIIKIMIRNGAKTISPQTLFGRLNNNKKRSKNNKSPKQQCLGDLTRGHRCRDHMVVGFTTTCTIGAYHH